ncbi:MAG: plasmid pRiA4b ORF-3 family protein [Deltaproteobacteria bacterium]|nr:plasmid pRiA4b ORF-3 family protein [Deltaproteobacteria bacterium]
MNSKIELNDIEPLIWRRILVPSEYNLWDLHVAIQDAMGWLDCHLHHFEIKGKGKKKEERIGIPDFDRFDDSWACPPEDCGGVDGYLSLLEILADPANDEYEDMKTWVGENWDPEKFDKKAIVFDPPYKRWRKAFIR